VNFAVKHLTAAINQRVSAVHIEMLFSPYPVLTFLHSPAAPASALSLPPQPIRAAGWQSALRIRASFEPRMNADIVAEIRLYLNFHHIIKIKINNGRNLCSSVFICG